METETIQGNRVIDIFMGKSTEAELATPSEYLNDLQYHTSWNDLMPVVEKINTLSIDNEGDMEVVIHANMCQIGESGNPEIVEIINDEKPLIEIVWLAVIEFINWYNKNKQS